MVYPRITYVSDAIIDCRLRGIYTWLIRGQYNIARVLIIDTISEFQLAEIDVPLTFMSHVIDVLFHAYVDMNLKKYDAVHTWIRDLHYIIYNANL